MIGWIGDFFRFWWALAYWNTRKTWFRLHGAHRDSCPCQNQSDSGLAGETRCDAVMQWQSPGRFRRVCPLLKQTAAGWRCGTDAEGVRPFWGRAVIAFGTLLLLVYLITTLAFFAALRTARYEISYLDLLWPGEWHEVGVAQEKLYASRAQQALAHGNYREAMLALDMVCQLNPENYAAALALAQLNLVAARPEVADHIFARLLQDMPEQRVQTAQLWYRLLLARAAFAQIKPLAAQMLVDDPEQRGVWLHALLFAARATGDQRFLGDVLLRQTELPAWCRQVMLMERALLQDHMPGVLPQLTRVYGSPPATYLPYFQVDRLLLHHLTDDALMLLNAYGTRLPAEESGFLRLRLYRAKGWESQVADLKETLLQYPLAPRVAGQFSAALLSEHDPELSARYLDRFLGAGPVLTTETLPLYHAAYLLTAIANDPSRSAKIAARITAFTGSDARALRGLGEMLRSGAPDDQLARLLPLVPLPIEVIYVIRSRPWPVAKP